MSIDENCNDLAIGLIQTTLYTRNKNTPSILMFEGRKPSHAEYICEYGHSYQISLG